MCTQNIYKKKKSGIFMFSQSTAKRSWKPARYFKRLQ